MKDIVTVGALRTPIDCLQGALLRHSAVEPGSVVLKAPVEQTGIGSQSVDEVTLGQVLAAGIGQNPARQSVTHGGLLNTVSAITINNVCGPGLKALRFAIQTIWCGEVDVTIAGSQESMGRVPHVLTDSRIGAQLGSSQLIDSLVHDGLWDAFNDYHMGVTAENLAREYGISRELQDAWALSSQHKVRKAIDSGRFRDEIVPVITEHSGVARTADTDEQPRVDVSMEGLASLQSTFDRLESVTADNASSINDGAVVVMMTSEAKALELELPTLARIRTFASVGVDPALIGIVPMHTTRRCLERAGWRLDNIDLIEANEAFVARAISVGRALEWDERWVSVNGGVIALGHPTGVPGCRILVLLVHEMIKCDARRGLVTLCIGDGQGVALTVERV